LMLDREDKRAAEEAENATRGAARRADSNPVLAVAFLQIRVDELVKSLASEAGLVSAVYHLDG
jgi:hypothetical protein